MSGADEGRAQAARDLLAVAAEALRPLGLANFVLVGAQAVYLRTSRTLPNLPAYTYDADILADTRFVSRTDIYDRLIDSGFQLRGKMPGFFRLGSPSIAPGVAVLDMLVPERGVPMTETDLNSRGLNAAFSQPGLEMCVVDNSPLYITPEIKLNVAGLTGLIVAKSWKIGERFDQGPDAFELVGKDIADVFRLLSAGNRTIYEDAVRALPPEAYVRASVRAGSDRLRETCSIGGPGQALIARMMGSSDEAPAIVAALPILVDEFCDVVKANIGPE